ncbi:IMP dehydrogenase [Verrucomicrobia bacterium LW23]|nr:IMP dehydrogenase [Verrucomicrobia bacterium LW23]
MALHVALNHVTHYRYDRPVSLSPQIIRLRPAPHARTPIVSYSLKISPAEHFINWQQDPQSNYQARVVFEEKVRELRVEVDVVAEMAVINPFDFFLEDDAQEFPFTYDHVLDKELAPFLEKLPLTPKLEAFIKTVDTTKRRTIDFLVDLNRRMWREIEYTIRLEPGVQTCEQTLTLKKGSCRDSAWLMVQVLRNLGLAARFASGYLIQLTPDVKSLDGPVGASSDFTDLHAWTEVYLPGAGWIGLDPTSGLLAGEGHIPLACTPDPSSAAPITGFLYDNDAKSEFDFAMSVTRVYETPRVTKPYTEEQWEAIEALGHKVDERLKAGDVRLTMGGEPTFVSATNMDGEEWNFTALSPEKARMGGTLLKRLKNRWSPGALLHWGQGKWYPGEPLPRWAYSCYWRRDGVPIWEDPKLIGDEGADYGYTDKEAMNFISVLADRLDLDPSYCISAYEDVFYYLWKERRLPVNVDPFQSKLKEKIERDRLARIFEQGLDKVVGGVLPLTRRWTNEGKLVWATGPWFLRPERMYLLPGDSPMGFRLPLDSLPWVAKSDMPWVHEQDPMEARGPLPKPARRSVQPFVTSVSPSAYGGGDVLSEFQTQAGGSGGGGGFGPGTPTYRRPKWLQEYLQGGEPMADQYMPGPGVSNPYLTRTALCVEPREGRLFVFMPPVNTLEDYLELVTAIEDTASVLELPVQIEGYQPPSDHRLNHFRVTPDPGVIEVNLHPSHSWDELVKNTTELYEEARYTGLGSEKFMLDGRHVGTGGGNHIIIGGATPSDSPILRRPDVLKSLLNFWNNHPSLSFLFSGLFIGPTSQAPRIDEARNDSIYEMEIAFNQVPDAGGYIPPWLVDRIFRHLLVDTTGNTHRAEFCIDKLFSPDGSAGRQGLVELRSFEMPPHSRMSLTQQLLLRSLVARFWESPYKTRLVSWGTDLHDRFMLPHFVSDDFSEVIQDLQEHGFPIQKDWFAPHIEFRFPKIGDVTYRNVNVELRTALEPWHVLGEEGGGSGTVRYVDSSVERLQVKVQGMTHPRHVVLCNGRQVPLHPTGVNGEYVAGVRYRAWQPPSCLHPTIGVDTPLVFDVYDTWSDRSTGGCRYYVQHPGGVNSSRFPINAYEAEARRLGRFQMHGHTPGKFRMGPPEKTEKLPFTLDLRIKT